MIRAVIFDMDGTLFDTEKVYHEAWRAAGVETGIPSERLETTLKACTGRNAKDTRAYFDEHMADLIGYDDFIAVRTRLYDEIVARMGGTPKKAGLDELLAYLKASGYRIGLATSTRRPKTMGNLEQTGILPYFDAIVTGDMVENGKPHPETYLRAAEALGIAPAECMGVEDSLAGVEAIHRAGMLTVMVPDLVEPTPRVEAMLDVKCASLHDIIPLLQHLAQSGAN